MWTDAADVQDDVFLRIDAVLVQRVTDRRAIVEAMKSRPHGIRDDAHRFWNYSELSYDISLRFIRYSCDEVRLPDSTANLEVPKEFAAPIRKDEHWVAFGNCIVNRNDHLCTTDQWKECVDGRKKISNSCPYRLTACPIAHKSRGGL